MVSGEFASSHAFFSSNLGEYESSVSCSDLNHGNNQIGWAGVTQSVQRIAMDWTVMGSNPGGGKIFRTRPDHTWGPTSLLYNR